MSALPNINQETEVSLSEFLSAFYPDTQEKIHLRSFKAKGAPDSFATRPVVYERTRCALAVDTMSVSTLERANITRGIYFTVNSGGNSDNDITRYNAFFVESDTKTIEEQNEALDKAPIAPSIRNKTKKSVHAYWLIDGDCSEAEWREIQERLISYFDGDPTIKNPSRVMRLPLFNHITYNDTDNYSYIPVDVEVFEPSKRYTVAEMKKQFPEARKEPSSALVPISVGTPGKEFYSWDELNGELKRRIMSAGKQNKRGVYETKGICHNGESDRAIMFNPATGAVKCTKGCTHEQVLEAFNLPKNPVSLSLTIGGRKLLTVGSSNGADMTEIMSALVNFHTTDAGNAECMAALYRDKLRYCHTRDTWLKWDGIRWRLVAGGEATVLVVKMVRARQEAALQDIETKQQVLKWGLDCENITRIRAALALSSAMPEFRTTIDQYDADPLLATAENGTLDLRDGSFRDSVREDYLTMQLGTAFSETATAPRWYRFLQEVFGGDSELIEYIQRAVGYSMTGETKEQNLFLCYGTGANGKSVFLSILSQLLGDYAGASSFETLNAENRNEAGYDLAVLKGKRLVTVIEANEDRFLDEAKVKAVTGQDAISCRFMRRDFFTYHPEFKIWMAMNHKPSIRGTDNGIWRRIHPIPFTQSFERTADKDLVVKLRTELSGILSWALEGLKKWQKDGLGMPKAIEEATQEYRRESDAIGQWIEERTVKNLQGQLRANEGHKDYSDWALGRGERPFGLKTWSQSLIGRGYLSNRDKKGRCYLGLELADEA
jgi:putative DNA primase/helicase